MRIYSFLEFSRDYPNDDVSLDRLFKERYSSNVLTCPNCGTVDTKFYRLTRRKAYSCNECRYQIHSLAGTIFHKSDTPLSK